MQPPNRIKLNRSVFKLESVSAAKRRRPFGQKRDLDLASRDAVQRAQQTPPEPARGKTAHETGYDKVTLPPVAGCNKNTELKRLFGVVTRFGSGRPKRSVKSWCCALCGDVKYTPPANNKMPRVRKSKSRHRDPPQRRKGAMVRPGAQAQQKPGLDACDLRRYPKVKLCDVARVFDVTSRDFSCALPAALQRKRERKGVQCFKKECMPLMRRYRRTKWKCIASQMWKVGAPTNSCASLPSGEQVSDILVGHEGFTGTSDNHAKILDCKTMTRTSAEGTACAPFNCDGVQHSGETGHKEAATPVPRVPPLVLQRVPTCIGLGSPDVFRCVPAVDHNASPVGEDAEESCCVLEGNNLTQDSKDREGSLLSFSCQRTQPYSPPPCWSCARTDKSWPFPRRGPPSELKSSVRTGPRWILTSAASDVTDYGVGKAVTSSSLTVGENFVRLLRANVSIQAAPPGQGQSAKMSAMEKLVKIPEDPAAENHNNPEEPYIRSYTRPDTSPEMDSVPHQQDPPRLGSVEKVSSEAEHCCSPKVPCEEDDFSGLLSTQQTGIPDETSDQLTVVSTPGPVSVPLTRLVEPSPSDPFQNISFDQSALPSSGPTEVPVYKTSSETEPQGTSSETGSSAAVENSMDPLQPKKTDPALSPPNPSRWTKCFNSLTRKDDSSSSSSGEDDPISHLSFSGGSEEDDPEYPQDEGGELGKADQGMSSFSSCSPACSAVSGGDLDVVRAYEDDAIVLDVIQDDPELFGVIKLETAEVQPPRNGPVAGKGAGQIALHPEKVSMLEGRPRIVWGLESKRKTSRPAHTSVENTDGSPTVETAGKAQGVLMHSRTWTLRNPVPRPDQPVTDCNNNVDEGCSDTSISSGITSAGGASRSMVHAAPGISSSAVKPSPHFYCRYYFSEHHTCTRTTCWFLHLPRDDDEKFCMETVQKFCRAGGAAIVQRAVEVFVGYYRTNSPGGSFSQNIVNTLLFSLLNLALLRDLLSVINTLLSHSRTPPPELMVALYGDVRERGLVASVPELIFLTSKMMDAGCVFTVTQCEMMQAELQMLQVSRNQMDIFHVMKSRALVMNPLTTELSALSDLVVQIEVCKQQENWPRLASVFCSVCDGRYSAGELSRLSCCVTTALLKEPKDKLTLPYEPFAESVCQEVPLGGLVRSFLGRVGVSLLFRYHRTHDLAKGVKLVLVMSRLHVEFSKFKGLFGSEDGASRCQLITIATELFLHSGSIEGALNVLRDEDWFVSSAAWPCDQADVENRRRVLTLLAGKTSHRDTLEVLSNLPGLRQPLDGIQVGEYSSVFSAHLQKCMVNQVLLVAADTLEFMLTQGISTDASQLQNLIHKLGKQNMWSRARVLFKCAHSAGYYAEVLCEWDSLAMPCSLSEIEMTLAFEMFITRVRQSLQNPRGPSSPLLITLKRTSGGEAVKESAYLAAGCHVLSAALIPNPKLNIRYVAVNQDQEQFFHLDRTSATKWLSHNHTWAQDMWTN
ncbi:hypothetical protein NFI96_006886 [Prochilodus magdalenae]|nr:hypothetical protein NFI96_006886 [Prochilodus magdalenae]